MHPKSTYKSSYFRPQKRPENTAILGLLFTGKEKDSETGYYYFGARYYNSDLSLWLSVDPMSDQNPNISPYHYCHWNPMRIVDPDGRDDWEVDKLGQLHWKSRSDKDVIRSSSGESITVKDGVLNRGQSYTKNNNGYLLLNFGGDSKNADEVFRFLADNTDVEFSLIGYADSKMGDESNKFVLTSSFDEGGDYTGTEQAYGYALEGTLRDHSHNHPNGNMQPSGLYDPRMSWTIYDKGNDVRFAGQMKEILKKTSPNAVFNAYIYAGKGRNAAFPRGGYGCYSSTSSFKYTGRTYTPENALKRYSR